MDEFWKLFNILKRLLPTLVALEGRQLYPILAIVSDNEDPENIRRIKYKDPLLDNLYESEWALPRRATPSSDPMLPKIGQTVIIDYLNGDPQKPVYSLYHNEPNPSREKNDPINDAWDDVDGNTAKTIGGNHAKVVGKDSSEIVKGSYTSITEGASSTLVKKDVEYKVEGDRTEEVDKDYDLDVKGIIKVKSGKEVTILAGSTTIKIKSSGEIEIKGTTTKIKSRKIKLDGKTTIKGKQVAVLGAKDTKGHRIIRSGQ